MHKPIDMHSSHGDANAGAVDPVCGMAVDPDDARDRGLHVRHDDVDHFFCGKGCKLDFLEDPGQYLAPGYRPHM
jgi:Cu+-exporting ATPase